ncbi:MAG: thioesterase family protein [Actinomycetota bacterium]|nr:thioesterase family protein [Actinomycetota bacterium]
MAEAFYVPDGDRYVPTSHTRGPWDPAFQHAGPPAALVGREIERCQPRDGFRVGRITCDILRAVPIAPLTVSARVVRPGRSVELLEGSLSDEGGEVMRASAWRVRTAALPIPAELAGPPAPPPPSEGRAGDPPFFGEGAHEFGYHRAMEWSFVAGAFDELGPATVWLRMLHPLVPGEEPSPLVRVLVAADSGNGVSASLEFQRWVFVNTDLTVHLHRHPAGEWVCLDSATFAAPDGVGLSDTALFDERGQIGRAAQTLLVDRRPTGE